MSKHKDREVEVTREIYQGERVVRVPLSRGKSAVLYEADWNRITDQYGDRWSARSNGDAHWTPRKAVRSASGRIILLSLARAVMQAQTGDRVETANGDALDCRRSNLKLIPAARANERRQAQAEERWSVPAG